MTRKHLLAVIAEHSRLKTNARILRDWPKHHFHQRQELIWRIHLKKYEYAAVVVGHFAQQWGPMATESARVGGSISSRSADA